MTEYGPTSGVRLPKGIHNQIEADALAFGHSRSRVIQAAVAYFLTISQSERRQVVAQYAALAKRGLIASGHRFTFAVSVPDGENPDVELEEASRDPKMTRALRRLLEQMLIHLKIDMEDDESNEDPPK